ncbi:MAG: RagB/SusD family nutrient uptake outer membrane protein [Bacteroidales bacterium]|jgi:hypothetical protein|nr:RagB/SusD family nutrient uptake outer membrane protein [Bacteroidales bacterium]
MKRTLFKITYLLALICVSPLLNSCSDYLTVEPEEVVLEENMFRDKNDANAIVKGIYGKVITIAEQYVVLNELRADLMDVTPNADYELQEINNHNVSSKNRFADPLPFYAIINQCNNALVHFEIMYEDLKLLENDYLQLSTDVGVLRSWLYLNLVTQFGEVPYVTQSVESIESIQEIATNSPMLGIEEMVDTLVNYVENLPYHGRYTDSEMLTSIDGYPMNFLFIDKMFFLGDLYLWDNQYLQAASMYKSLMSLDIGRTNYNTYKIPRTFDPYNVDQYNSNYYRYYYWDVNSALNHWPMMFSSEPNSEYYNEWIWAMKFDETYAPENPFFNLFSISQGEHMLQPSKSIINQWDKQEQQNGFIGDFRGNTGSYDLDDKGQNPEITKYSAEFDILNPFDKSGKFMLMRAALLHLRYCEAANRDNEHLIAYHLINDGIANISPIPDGATNVSQYNNTLKPFPYNFDALSSQSYHIPSMYRGEWYRNAGIRSRVYLKNAEIPAGSDSTLAMEDIILDEAAMEMAFEGNRWGDLVRIALRRNDPSYLADRVYDKLKKGNNPNAEVVRQKLLNPDNWFLPLTANENE